LATQSNYSRHLSHRNHAFHDDHLRSALSYH
jgi:hypothetical protein